MSQKTRNPVAKNMNKFNKCATHRDKKNDYRRNEKHRKDLRKNGGLFCFWSLTL